MIPKVNVGAEVEDFQCLNTPCNNYHAPLISKAKGMELLRRLSV